jgi:hypothetical protein
MSTNVSEEHSSSIFMVDSQVRNQQVAGIKQSRPDKEHTLYLRISPAERLHNWRLQQPSNQDDIDASERKIESITEG